MPEQCCANLCHLFQVETEETDLAEHSCFTIVIQSSHRRTEKKKNRSSDIFEDILPMINAAFFFFFNV